MGGVDGSGVPWLQQVTVMWLWFQIYHKINGLHGSSPIEPNQSQHAHISDPILPYAHYIRTPNCVLLFTLYGLSSHPVWPTNGSPSIYPAIAPHAPRTH